MRSLSLLAVTLVACSVSHPMEPTDAGAPDVGLPDTGAPDAGVDAAPPPPCEAWALEIGFVPRARAQLAVWIEHDDGARLETVAVTEATSLRGLGNRPGAQQMNTGFAWPMGRRLDVLPRWAGRRLETGGRPFRSVVFLEGPEGFASGHAPGPHDPFYCMSFDARQVEQMDAVSCASYWAGEAGRYLGDGEAVEEPFVDASGARMRPVPPTSPYPPRRDRTAPEGEEHADVGRFAADALAIMPELDAITVATPSTELPARYEARIPADRPVSVYVEAHTELDWNDAFPQPPVPSEPEGAWDWWAEGYGLARGGQPSAVYRVEVDGVGHHGTAAPIGRTAHFATGPALVPPDDLTDDPDAHPGSGADRLRLEDGERVQVDVTCAR
ncbi:MAG: hypothetical protein VYE22_40035 [Myxococcota bacterium]|nr:hypothetical protein [Myxococcota bacterium]